MKLLIPLFFAFITLFSIPVYANQDCAFSSEEYSYAEKLTAECKEQLIKNSITYNAASADKPVSVFRDAPFFEIAFDILFKGELPDYKDYGDKYFVVIGISLFLVIAIVLGFLYLFYYVVRGLIKMSLGQEGNLKVGLGSLLFKIPLFLISKYLFMFCMAIGAGLMLDFSYNVVNIKKKIDSSNINIQQLISVGASRDAQDRVNDLLTYATCVIQHDKQMLFMSNFKEDYKFDYDKEYHSCMIKDADITVADSNNAYYNSLYFRKALNCGRRHIGLEEMTCAISEFKDENMLIKKAFEENEVLITSIADKIIRFGCANVVGVNTKDKSHDFRQYCYELNPITREMSFDDKGRVNLISKAPSSAEMKKDVNALIQIIKQANINAASKNIKDNFKPEKLQINELSAFLVFLFENEDIQLIKTLAKESYDYNFTIKETLVFSKSSSTIFGKIYSTVNSAYDLFFGSENKLPSIQERIKGEINNLTVREDAIVKDFLFPSIDFLGADFTQSLGYEGNNSETLRFNIVGSVVSLSMESGFGFLIPATAARVSGEVATLITNNRVDSKPSIIATKYKALSNFIATKMFIISFLFIGLGGYIIVFTIKLVIEGMMHWFTNSIKLMSTKDTIMATEMNGNKGIGFDEIKSKMVSLSYVMLGLIILIMAYLISIAVIFALVYVSSGAFSIIMQSIGIFDTSDLGSLLNFMLGLVIYYFIIMYLQLNVFSKTFNGITNTFIVHASGSQERTTQALMGVKGNENSLANALRPKGRI